MNDISAILIATVGVFGTLAASIISQRLSSRARREEFEMQKSERLEGRQHEQLTGELAKKRSSYIAFMASARRYRTEITNYLYIVQQGTADRTFQANLEDARQAYINSFAEAQLSASPQVLVMLEPFNIGLGKAYRAAKRLEHGKPEPDDSIDKIESSVQELWSQWNDMREAMRQDLGVQN